jgi:hypothetical protein
MVNINDGGHDAPLTPRDTRFIIGFLLAIAAVGAVVAVLLTLVGVSF